MCLFETEQLQEWAGQKVTGKFIKKSSFVCNHIASHVNPISLWVENIEIKSNVTGSNEKNKVQNSSQKTVVRTKNKS